MNQSEEKIRDQEAHIICDEKCNVLRKALELPPLSEKQKKKHKNI